MYKVLTFILLLIILSGCPAYDPPQKGIEVHNYTDSAVYVYYSCSDSIKLNPKLKLFDTITYNGEDQIISPGYRVNAYAYGGIGTQGRELLINGCPDKKLRLFIVKETTIRNKSWRDIFNMQLYEKRINLTVDDLKNMDWLVTYP